MRQITTLFLLIISIPAWSQELQTPDEFLGYPLGSRFTRHHKIVEYYHHVASVMSNVKIMPYGETNELRPLITAVISSQANFDNLENIRLDNLRRARLEPGQPSGTNVAIVWLSYNVHGNESSSSEATMKTLYELANPENSKTQEWLKNTVVILDPCINPDGRDRYANYFNQYGSRIPNPDLNGKEHREPWPLGRTNHYLFDLNRDWAWVTQKESKGRIALYNQWMPHVHVDFHEQGMNSPYYFPPAAQPYHEIITPWQREFQRLSGKNNAKYFDPEGWLYFTKEVFDLFYPSYGDTYPTFNGGIGMTFEKGGGGRAGLAGKMANGDTVTLHDRLLHHHTTGLSTVEVSSVNADRLLQEFESYFTKATTNPGTTYNTYVIKGTNPRSKLKALTDWMDSQQIQYGTGSASKRLSGFSYMTATEQSVTIAANDILVSTSQPKSNFVNAVFEPSSRLVDSLTYDITAWAVPYVYGLDAYAIKEKLSVDTGKGLPEINVSLQGQPYAYVGAYETLNDVKWLAYLLNNKVQLRSAERSFTVEGKSFPAGTLLALRWDNEHVKDFDALMTSAAEMFEKVTEVANTGYVDSGKDFGSGSYKLITPPRVALLGGDQTSSYNFGEAWYFFEQDVRYPVTVIDTDYFTSVDLDAYNVLVVPNGYYRIFNESGRKSISTWVRNGGRLVLIGSAIRPFANTEGFAIKNVDEEEEEESEQIKYADARRESLRNNMPGAIYNVTMDNTHPLAFGFGTRYPSMKLTSSRYALMENAWNVGIVASENDLLAGFVGEKLKPKFENTLVFGVENKGRGSVVYLVDNPLFRAFLYNGKMIFGNAVFIR